MLVQYIIWSCKFEILNGWRTPAAATATLTGFLGLDWMLGPLTPALIRISPSASDPCSRTCVVTLWCNRLHLTKTVDACHAVYGARLLHQGVFTTVCELRRRFMTLANINCCVSSRARGAAWLHGQLSTIRIQVPNRDSIRPNTNSPFSPLFGPVRIRIKYSVQP